MRNTTLDCILLIDDNQMTNFIHQTYIERLSLANMVLVALGGEEALSLLTRLLVKRKTKNNAVFPDLILLDLNMPNMTGHEFLEKYEATVPAKQIAPVVIVSSSNTRTDLKKAKKFKTVIDYRVKPIKKEGWLELMNQI